METRQQIPYPEELFDPEGYPSSEALSYITNWELGGPFFGHSSTKDLWAFVEKLWIYPDYIRRKEHLLELHTGGWSGNEEVIQALKKTSFWLMHWRISASGGHHYFSTGTLMEELTDEILHWEVKEVKPKKQKS